MPTETPPLSPARPVLSVAGTVQAELTDGLIGLRVAEHVDGLASCELTVGNRGERDGAIAVLHLDRSLLEFGKELAVEVTGKQVFNGKITAIEAAFPSGGAPWTVTVLAEDRLQDLRMTRRTRTFEQVSDADACRQIASGHGLTGDVELPGPTHAVIAQLDQSDLAFVRDRCRAAGGEVWVDASTLKVRPRPDRGGESVTLAYGETLRELTVLADLAHQRTSVAVTGWDVAGKAALREEAREAAVQSELGDGEGGATILARAFADRVEVQPGHVPLTSDEARSRAEAAFRARARRFVRGRGVANPDGALRVGTTVRLERLGPLFDGAYHLVEVAHRFDGEQGLRTELTVERPGLGRAA